MKKIFHLIIAAVMLAGCKGKEPSDPETAVASIATYVATEQGVSTFTYTDNVGDLITLTALWNGNDDLKPDTRVLIYYRATQYGVSGEVTLLSVTRIPGGVPKITEEIPQSAGLQQCSVWRSGNFLNLSSVVTFGGDAREVSLYIDSATESLQVPTAYVVVASDYTGTGVERQLYASWDISSILSASNFEGLNVVYTDATSQLKTIKITE